MSAPEELKISRSALFTAEVDRALTQQRALTGRAAPLPARVSLLRRLLLSSLFYLPLAGMLGGLSAWLLLEPSIQDKPRAAGQVVLVNNDPFDAKGMVSITIGKREVLVDPDRVQSFPGARGEAPFASLDDIRPGVLVEAVSGQDEERGRRILANAIRPISEADAKALEERAENASSLALMAFFPLTATLIGAALLFAEVLSRRHWSRLVDRCLAGSALAALMTFLALIPGGIVFSVGNKLMQEDPESKAALMVFIACRSVAWACAGAGLGIGMTLARGTPAEKRNAAIGGALGGAFGGLFFDPIDWLSHLTVFDHSSRSRMVGVLMIGLSVGAFLALLERLTREAWVRVRTGPLAGKSFILYRSPTVIGSAPSADIYLFKDAAIDGRHACIHRVGQAYELEDQGSREGTHVAGAPVKRRRLSSGDQITIGSTVLEFEERAMRQPASGGAGAGAGQRSTASAHGGAT